MEALLIVLIIVVVLLLIALIYLLSKRRSLQHELELIQSEHRYRLTDIEKKMEAEIVNRAGERYVEWQKNEYEKVKTEQIEIARREAKALLELWKFESEGTIRSDAIARSQSVIVGKAIEHLIPYLPKFNFNPKDVRFFGDPIDLIVFDGLNDGYVKQIVFIEVKTGKSSRLSRKQQDLRDAVHTRPIKWLCMRVNHDGDGKSKSPIRVEEKITASGKRERKFLRS